MMTPAESTAEPGVGADFEAFYRHVEPRIRRALVAACGPTAGIEAAAAAMQLGFERWDTVRASGGPVDAAYSNGTAVAVGGSSVGAAVWILHTD